MRDNAAFWNSIAEKYAKQPVANPEAFEAKIAVTRSHMKATDVVLDIGCGRFFISSTGSSTDVGAKAQIAFIVARKPGSFTG